MSAFFFDIDGTLIDANRGLRRIPDSTVAQLERLHNAGHKLAICSGRPSAMIEDALRLPLFDAYVMCNGAHVTAGGKTIFVETLSPDFARHYASLFEHLGCEYMIQTQHHIYLDRRYTKLLGIFRQFSHDNIFTFDFDKDEALQRAIKLESNVESDQCERLIAEAHNVQSGYTAHADSNGGYNHFELYSPTISKAVGIQKVLDHFDIPRSESYAFGDGVNDLEMIQYAGTGVAMGNACDELKAAADVVCPDVMDDGLATFLSQKG